MDTTKKYFRQIPRESAGFKVTQNENFGLAVAMVRLPVEPARHFTPPRAAKRREGVIGD